MKYFIISILILFSFGLYGQHGFEVTTLDSIVTTTSNQGVYGLVAKAYNGNIHLAYIYGSADEKWYLMYEIRKDGNQISKEIVHEYSKSVWLDPKTAIQFDENGIPFIFVAQIVDYQTYITVADKTNGWNVKVIDYKHLGNYLHTSGDGELGFVTFKQGTNANNYRSVITYFNYKDGAWIPYTISSSSFYKGRPSSFHMGDITYVAFAEQLTPDSTKLYIYKNENENWSLDLEQLFVPGVSVNNSLSNWIKFGAYDNTIHALHTYDLKTQSQPLSHLVKTNNGWENLPIYNREEYLYEPSGGRNLDIDSEGNLYFVTRDIVGGINTDNEYFEFYTPLSGPYYGYYDCAILDDKIYVYIIAGNKNFPYGDPVMFYEGIGSISEITNVKELKTIGISTFTISPNPGHGEYLLDFVIENPTEITLQWINTTGQQIGETLKRTVKEGANSIYLNPGNMPTGMYLLRISSEYGNASIPVIQM